MQKPVDTGGLGWAIEVLSFLFEFPVGPRPSDLVKLSRKEPEESLGTCLFKTVTAVTNPFVAGMTVSVVLFAAADEAPHGERRKLASLQNKLDNLLLEILGAAASNRPGLSWGHGRLRPRV